MPRNYKDTRAAESLIHQLNDLADSFEDVGFLPRGLIEEIYSFLEIETVICGLCLRPVPELTVHTHQGKVYGSCCWDERLKTTS